MTSQAEALTLVREDLEVARQRLRHAGYRRNHRDQYMAEIISALHLMRKAEKQLLRAYPKLQSA